MLVSKDFGELHSVTSEGIFRVGNDGKPRRIFGFEAEPVNQDGDRIPRAKKIKIVFDGDDTREIVAEFEVK